MKKTKFTESQIVFALKQAETGVKVAEVCRKMKISESTFHLAFGNAIDAWKDEYNGVRPHRSLSGLTPNQFIYGLF